LLSTTYKYGLARSRSNIRAFVLMAPLPNRSNRTQQQVDYLTLAAKYREQAERSSDRTVSTGYVRLANGYDVLAESLGRSAICLFALSEHAEGEATGDYSFSTVFLHGVGTWTIMENRQNQVRDNLLVDEGCRWSFYRIGNASGSAWSSSPR
jgi:hypothetical protein